MAMHSLSLQLLLDNLDSISSSSLTVSTSPNLSLALSLQLLTNYHRRAAASSYTASIIGAVNSLFAAGAAFGAISQGWLGDWLGRKKAFIIAAALSAIGGALTAASQNVPMIIVVRFIQGVGLGQLISLVPCYIAEVAPPHRRGALGGLTAVSFATGYVMYDLSHLMLTSIDSADIMSVEPPGSGTGVFFPKISLCSGAYPSPFLVSRPCSSCAVFTGFLSLQGTSRGWTATVKHGPSCNDYIMTPQTLPRQPPVRSFSRSQSRSSSTKPKKPATSRCSGSRLGESAQSLLCFSCLPRSPLVFWELPTSWFSSAKTLA